MITFKSLDIGKFIFTYLVYLDGIWVKFEYEVIRPKSRSQEQKGRKSLFV